MTEPRAVASAVEQVAPGVWHWLVPDERIGAWSAGHAVSSDDGAVLVDPVPLAPEALANIGAVAAVCITAGTHQRSAWRYRRELGVKVYAPEGVRPMEEEPDTSYREGDELPGGLRPIRTPGPEEVHYAFLLEREPGVLFCPDLVTHYARELRFIPAEYHDDPRATRRSVRRLLDVPFSVLCFDHGVPIAADPHAALRALLERDELDQASS